MNRTVLLLLPSLLVACTSTLRDTTFATGSATILSNADHDAVYVVDTDGGQVVRFHPATGERSAVAVGVGPSRLARVENRVFVTLRGERSVAVLDDGGGTWSRVGTIEVGAEPVGIVAAENGKRLYVALSAQNAVVEIDAEAQSVLRTWEVGAQPEFLALHPTGNALYVGSGMGGVLSWIDLRAGGAVTDMDLPAIYGAGEDGSGRFTRRITGDLAVSPDGGSLAVPALFLDNTNPVSEPGEAEEASDGYGSSGLGVSRFNPSVVVVPLGGDGNPTVEDTATVLIAGFSQVNAVSDSQIAVRSYLTSATYSPDGESIYATMEASESVVVLSSSPLFPGHSACSFCESSFDTGGSSISASAAGFSSSPLVFIGTDAGPRGVAFLDDSTALVHAFLDRSVANLYASNARTRLGDQFAAGFAMDETFHGGSGTEIGDNVLDASAEAGRRLFYGATSSQMAAEGAGVSCSTCHFEGRNDGLTWALGDGVRQTPSLAGAVSITGPFTWTDEVASVADEALITSEGRMGGSGMSFTEAAQVGAFIDSTPAVDLPLKGSTDEGVLRGQAIFSRPDVACATCHSGDRFTDNLAWDMFGLEGVNTPTLIGIAATAPYLHDGSVATLEALLTLLKSGEMGNTAALSDDELADLELYLRSL